MKGPSCPIDGSVLRVARFGVAFDDSLDTGGHSFSRRKGVRRHFRVRRAGLGKIPVSLEVHPEFRGGSFDRLRQGQCRIRGYPPPEIGDLVETGECPSEMGGERRLGHSERFEDFFDEDATRMARKMHTGLLKNFFSERMEAVILYIGIRYISRDMEDRY